MNTTTEERRERRRIRREREDAEFRARISTQTCANRFGRLRCGKQAVGECDYPSMNLVCGAPFCATCGSHLRHR